MLQGKIVIISITRQSSKLPQKFSSLLTLLAIVDFFEYLFSCLDIFETCSHAF